MTEHFTTDIVVGLEVHVELKTKTKLFCSCPREAKPNEEPNTRTCPICLGHPGSKPVLNEKAVAFATQLCLATQCTIAPQLIFSRKSYFYPDMAKNYQITQYELPLGEHGAISLSSGKKIRLKRIHLEEDPASLVHPAGMRDSAYVLVDYNRSGNALVEIVTEPDLASADEARDFMKRLLSILTYLEIFDPTTCIIKADANISIKASGYTRVEIKNITGFKEIERALEHEISRQQQAIADGHSLHQETRGWDAQKALTHLLRKKEQEEEYGYIIDPDLVVTHITKENLSKLKKALPELAEQKVERFVTKYKIARADAEVLAQDKDLAGLYERVAQQVDAQLAAKWLRRELVRVLNFQDKTLQQAHVDEAQLTALLALIEDKKITDKVGQRLIEQLIEKPFNVKAYVKEHDLQTLEDTRELEEFCRQAIKENPAAVSDYKKGEEKAFNFLVGMVMRKAKGKADPGLVHEKLKRLLEEYL